SPRLKAAALRLRTADVVVQLLEDVPQRRRRLNPGRHRERQSVGLARSVVRVLAEDQNFDAVERREFERVEHVRLGRVKIVLTPLRRKEALQLVEIRLPELDAQHGLPGGGQSHRHGAALSGQCVTNARWPATNSPKTARRRAMTTTAMLWWRGNVWPRSS